MSNNLKQPQTYTFITSPDGKRRWAFYLDGDKLYDFDVFRQEKANRVLTFPTGAINNYKEEVWKPPGDRQKVKNTADGYIQSADNGLYFVQDNSGNVSFVVEKPAPMKYYLGAWNDFIVNAKDYGEKVLADSVKYFTQLYCGGPLGLTFDSSAPNDKCFCTDSGSKGDGNLVVSGDDPKNNAKDFYQKDPDSNGRRVSTLCYRDRDTDTAPFMSFVGRSYWGEGAGDMFGRGGAGADNSTFMFNGYDKNNKEKCINLHGDVVRSYPGPPFGGAPRKGEPIPGGNNFVNSMKCAISYDGMVVGDYILKTDAEKPQPRAHEADGFTSIKPPINGESRKDKTGNQSLNYETVKFGDNVLWFPFASGTADSDTIIQFCGSPDEKGKIRRLPDSNHQGCRSWVNNSEAKVHRYEKLQGRTPLQESQKYTCTKIRDFMNANNERDFDYCGPLCGSAESGCKSDMLTYCKEGDNFQKQVCRDFCKNADGACDNDVSVYCKAKYEADNNILSKRTESLDSRTSLDKICSCFYPPQAYLDYAAKATKVVTESGTNITLPSNPLQTVTKPICYFPKCTDSMSVKPKVYGQDIGCPSIQQCIQIMDPRIASSNIGGNVTIQSSCSQSQASELGLCRDPAYPQWDETEQMCVARGTASQGGVVERKYSDSTTSSGGGGDTAIGKGTPTTKCESGQVISRSGTDCLLACPLGQVKNTATNQCVFSSELPEDQKTDSSKLWIIGGIVGGIALLLLIIIIIVATRRR